MHSLQFGRSREALTVKVEHIFQRTEGEPIFQLSGFWTYSQLQR